MRQFYVHTDNLFIGWYTTYLGHSCSMCNLAGNVSGHYKHEMIGLPPAWGVVSRIRPHDRDRLLSYLLRGSFSWKEHPVEVLCRWASAGYTALTGNRRIAISSPGMFSNNDDSIGSVSKAYLDTNWLPAINFISGNEENAKKLHCRWL